MKIMECKKCSLCNNQLPLIDVKSSADIMWVGLSAKKVEDVNTAIPLSNDTNSGKMIDCMESGLGGLHFVKTNLVKCLPLDEQLKLRYPTSAEMKACYSNLVEEIAFLQPKVIFLLGMNVAKFVMKEKTVTLSGLDHKYFYSYYNYEDINYVPIHHPSYISVYKRKQTEQYILGVQTVINEIFDSNLVVRKDKVMEIA